MAYFNPWRPPSDDRQPGDAGISEPEPLERGHRWTCPIYDASRLNPTGEAGRSAVRALDTHALVADAGATTMPARSG